MKGLAQEFTVTTLFIIFYSFYRYQRVITCQSHYAIDVCTTWKISMTSGREVLMQLLCWRAVLDNQRAALKWYKLIIIVVVVIVVIIIIIIIIIIILVIPFMQGIYNYIPETKHFSRVYSAAAVLYLRSMLHVMLFHKLDMFCTFTPLLPKLSSSTSSVSS